MASVLAQLKALVTADAKGFKAGMNDAERSVSRFQKSVSSIGNYIASAFSVGAIVAYAKSVINWAGEMADAAKNAGVLTSEMMAFNNVALQSGVGIDKMQNMLIRLQDQLDAAVNGDEKATAAFERMRLSIDDLVQMTPAQMMVELAKASTHTGASISALADIFGMKLGPAARAALTDIANGLPLIDQAAADAVDALDANADRWASIWDRMKAPAAHGLAAIGSFFEDWQNAITGGVDAAFDELDKIVGGRMGEGVPLDPAVLVKGLIKGWKSSRENRNTEVENKRKKKEEDAKLTADQLKADRAKALEEQRKKEVETARKINDELLRARLSGIEKIKDEAKRAEDEITAKLKTANGDVKELLKRRLQIVRENAQQQIDEINAAEEKKRQAERDSVFKDKEGIVQDIVRLTEQTNEAAKRTPGKPIEADSLSRMGGFVGGFRPDFAVADRNVRIQEENTKALTELGRKLEQLNTLNTKLIELDENKGGIGL